MTGYPFYSEWGSLEERRNMRYQLSPESGQIREFMDVIDWIDGLTEEEEAELEERRREFENKWLYSSDMDDYEYDYGQDLKLYQVGGSIVNHI